MALTLNRIVRVNTPEKVHMEGGQTVSRSHMGV